MDTIIDNKKVWDETLSKVELSLSKANFNTWFKDTSIIKYEKGIIYLAVPNEFVKNWLYEKYNKYIIKILRDSLTDIKTIKFIIKDTKQIDKTNPLLNQFTPSVNNRLPLDSFYIDKKII